MNYKETIKKVIPKSLLVKLRSLKNNLAVEKRQLNAVPKIVCDTTNLLSDEEVQLDKVFKNEDTQKAWYIWKDKIQTLGIPDFTGGVNPGDRKALFYLIHHFKPVSVLEIGTHIGASTVNIAAALKSIHKDTAVTPQFKTLDIRDVNCDRAKPWLEFGTTQSPKELLKQIDLANQVEFITHNAVDYLTQTSDTYDFIFLDGDHSSRGVYKEIPLALSKLNKGGIILLHDFYPEGKSPWDNDDFIYGGPHLAVARHIKDGANLTVLPIGELPWPTKLNSNVTSLALLLKSN